MHEMRTIAIDDPGRLSVSLPRGFIQLRCANTAERIEVLLRVETLGDPRNIVLDRSRNFFTDSMRPLPNYFDNLFALILDCLKNELFPPCRQELLPSRECTLLNILSQPKRRKVLTFRQQSIPSPGPSWPISGTLLF